MLHGPFLRKDGPMSKTLSQRAFLLIAIFLAYQPRIALPAEGNEQDLPAPSALEGPSSLVRQLTLQEAKERALAASKLLNLASMNAEAKAYAIKVARSDYFPKVIG